MGGNEKVTSTADKHGDEKQPQRTGTQGFGQRVISRGLRR